MNCKYAGHRLPRLELQLGRLAADGERAGVVRVVAAEADTQVEDVELARLDRPIPRRTAAGGRAKVLAQIGERLAERPHRHGRELVVDVDFVHAGPDHLAGPRVHRAIRVVCPAEHRQLVGILVPPQSGDDRADVDEVRRTQRREKRQVRTERGELGADALGHPPRERLLKRG